MSTFYFTCPFCLEEVGGGDADFYILELGICENGQAGIKKAGHKSCWFNREALRRIEEDRELGTGEWEW